MNVSKHRPIYLDNNATTPLDPEVLKAVNHALKHCWGNPSCSHSYGIKAKAAIDEARKNVARMIGSNAASDIIFTSGGTEANNMVISSITKYYTRFCEETSTRPHIITSNMEHDSIKIVLQQMANDHLLEYTIVNASQESGGTVKCEDIIKAVKKNTCLISIMLANNETGIIQPVAEIAKAIRNLNDGRNGQQVFVHTDAAQAIGKVPVNIEDLDVDYLTIVGHKFYGPRIGALYVRGIDERQTPLHPVFYGGGQERNLRSGTENTGMIAGLGKAAELVADNLEKYAVNMKKSRDYLESRLESVFGNTVHFNGRFLTSQRIPNTCNFSFIGNKFKGYDVLSNARILLASVGAACHAQDRPSEILLSIGIPKHIACNALRLSVGRETTLSDIDEVIIDLQYVVNKLKPN